MSTDSAIPGTLPAEMLKDMPMGHRHLVLVHPPQQGLLEGFASGLVALANYVAAKLPAISVQLLDLGLADETSLRTQIQKIVSDRSDRLFVGITTTTASYRSALRVAKLFKQLDHQSVVVMGGHHATAQDDVILDNHDCVDCVIRGEGEIALVELLRRYPALECVPNLTYREGLEAKRNRAHARLLQTSDLDQIPPTFKGAGLRSAPGKFDHTTYVSARGCPLQCAFCAVGDATIRAKSIPVIIEDLRQLVGKMGYRQIAIEDNFFAQNPKRTLGLCRAIERLRRELPFSWDCQTRVESCRPAAVLEAMERAGCEAVYLGVESFDEDQLRYLRKTAHPDSYLRDLREIVVPQLLRSRIECYINLQLGLPGEDDSQRETSIHVLRELGRQAKAHNRQIVIFPQLHVVYPGTRHFQEAIRDGRFGKLEEDAFEEFTRWEEQQQPIRRWLGERFAHGTGGIPEGIIFHDLLKQRGQFEVNPDAVMNLTSYLDAMEDIEGIRVFRYGRYLALTNRADVS